MSHFAKIENGIVVQVIVADQEVINSGAVGDPVSKVITTDIFTKSKVLQVNPIIIFLPVMDLTNLLPLIPLLVMVPPVNLH